MSLILGQSVRIDHKHDIMLGPCIVMPRIPNVLSRLARFRGERCI